jgi:hypothetical protein
LSYPLHPSVYQLRHISLNRFMELFESVCRYLKIALIFARMVFIGLTVQQLLLVAIMRNYYRHFWLYPFFLLGSFIRYVIGTCYRKTYNKPTLPMSEYFKGLHPSLKVYRENDANIINTMIGFSFLLFCYIVLKGFKLL